MKECCCPSENSIKPCLWLFQFNIIDAVEEYLFKLLKLSHLDTNLLTVVILVIYWSTVSSSDYANS